MVTDLDSACRALEEIVEQGEGDMASMYDADGDLAHYFRFEQLKYGRAYQPGDDVGDPDRAAGRASTSTPSTRCCANPQAGRVRRPGPAGRRRARPTATWSLLLIQIDEAFNGDPGRADPRRAHACSGCATPCSCCSANPLPGHHGYHAGPTFEWADVRARTDSHPLDSEGRSVIFPIGATRRTQHQTAAETVYDAVVVGAGISGAIIADELSRAGKRVLILEAGLGAGPFARGLRGLPRALLRRRRSRTTSRPYPLNPNAPMPRSTDAHRIRPGQPDASGYLVQNGPFATDTTYTRVLGGTTMHWEGKTPRMLPEDFEMRTRYGAGPGLAARATTT